VSVVEVTYYTDPVCPWSWGLEPAMRKLSEEFAGEVQFTYVMCGMVRQLEGGVAHDDAAFKLLSPGPRAPAELWRLALDWRVKVERVHGGELWTLA
jgi:hypothetical protein